MNLLINYSHKWWYKALSVLLVIALILAISFGAAPRAHAVGVLTITVCAAILAVMAGAGIATVVSGMTSADIQNWMTGKLNEWDTYRNDGNVFTDLIQNNLITTTVKGALAIGNGAARGISDFIDWLIDDLQLYNNTTNQVISSSTSYGRYQGLVTNSLVFSFVYNNYGERRTFTYVSNEDVFFAVDNTSANYYEVFCVSDSSFQVQIYLNGTLQTTTTATFIGNQYYFNYNSSSITVKSGLQMTPNLPVNTYSDDAYSYYSNTGSLTLNQSGSLDLNTDVINIPSVADDGQTDIVIGIDGVYPGATTDEAADVIMDGVLDNTLDTTMTVTDEYVDAVEAVVINEQPISVNTDHHMIGFTNLPDFVNLNLNSIWHYVSDAVEYASGFISWFVNLLSSVPTLAIPLYMSFTLLIVLSFIRRILL